MKVDPQLLLSIILHTRVMLVVESVQSSTYYRVQTDDIIGVIPDPLRMSDKFNDVSSGANSIWKSGCSIPSEAEKGDQRGSVGKESVMFSWLLVGLSLLSHYRTHNGSGGIRVVEDPWSSGVSVPFFLLSSEDIDPLGAHCGNCDLVLVLFHVLESVRVQNLLECLLVYDSCLKGSLMLTLLRTTHTADLRVCLVVL